jgi:hypothetical protein
MSFLTLPLPFRAHAAFARRVFASSLPLLAQMKSGSLQSHAADTSGKVNTRGVNAEEVSNSAGPLVSVNKNSSDYVCYSFSTFFECKLITFFSLLLRS